MLDGDGVVLVVVGLDDEPLFEPEPEELDEPDEPDEPDERDEPDDPDEPRPELDGAGVELGTVTVTVRVGAPEPDPLLGLVPVPVWPDGLR